MRRAALVRQAVERAEKGHNGWANYETWCVSLWLGNDRGTYNMTRELAERCKADAPGHENTQARDGRAAVWTVEEAARFTLADALKELVEEMQPNLGASVFSDLLGSAMAEVEWVDIAESMLEE